MSRVTAYPGPASHHFSGRPLRVRHPQDPVLAAHAPGGQRRATRHLSADSCIEGWLATERALAQGAHGVLSADDAAAIAAAARLDTIDRDALWETSKNVGYPILGLVRQISAALPDGPNGRVHYGATTQDIMDTGLALQLARSLAALDWQLGELGDALAVQVEAHAGTVMPGRTHAQQAVPTTFGATLATLLGQFTRHRERLQQAVPRIAVISLFGAGGASAALGAKSADVRTRVADLLGLHGTDIPWHVDRDGIAEYGWLCDAVAATCAKLARNIVDLSRTEIGEVFEPYKSHRGASSTMPQKVNPISSEAIIGLSQTAGALLSSVSRIQEAGHERSAGEWQIEWQVIPQLGVLAGSALSEALVIVTGMRVDADRMREPRPRRRAGHDRGADDPTRRSPGPRTRPRPALHRRHPRPDHASRARRHSARGRGGGRRRRTAPRATRHRRRLPR